MALSTNHLIRDQAGIVEEAAFERLKSEVPIRC